MTICSLTSIIRIGDTMKLRKELIVFMVMAIVLLVIGSFFDYQISNYLFNSQSLISKSVNIVVELPTYLMMAFFSGGIFNTRNHDENFASYASAMMGLGLMIIFGFMCGYQFLLNMGLYSITLTLAVDIGICISAYILTKLISDHHALGLRKLSKVALISFFIMLLTVVGIKCVFHRVPFRRLYGSLEVYAPWYQSQVLFDLLSYDLRSLPSSGCSLAAMLLMLILIPEFVFDFKDKKEIVMILICAWIFLVAMSLIILGYAYLSDVVLGMMISVGSIVIAYAWVYLRKQ